MFLQSLRYNSTKKKAYSILTVAAFEQQNAITWSSWYPALLYLILQIISVRFFLFCFCFYTTLKI